jgi:hypothetical protein
VEHEYEFPAQRRLEPDPHAGPIERRLHRNRHIGGPGGHVADPERQAAQHGDGPAPVALDGFDVLDMFDPLDVLDGPAEAGLAVAAIVRDRKTDRAIEQRQQMIDALPHVRANRARHAPGFGRGVAEVTYAMEQAREPVQALGKRERGHQGRSEGHRHRLRLHAF